MQLSKNSNESRIDGHIDTYCVSVRNLDSFLICPHTCAKGDADQDRWNKGGIAPVSVELVNQGHEENAKGVGYSVG